MTIDHKTFSASLKTELLYFFCYLERISRTDEEAKDENRFGTRDHNRFGTGDEKRSRFDRRLNERPQKGLSEKFAPER